MNILVVTNMYPSKEKPYSGVFVKNQYEYLKNQLNQDISIYTMKRIFTSKIGSIFKYLKFYFGFIPFLFKKFDIIHIHFFGYHIFLGYIYKLFHPKTKLIVTFHGSDVSYLDKKIFKLTLNKINSIIAVGKEQAKLIYKKTAFQDIKVLSAGVDQRIFYKENEENKLYDFIFIGSFYDIKGVDIFIESIKILNDKNIKYCFVGSGEYEKELLRLKEDGYNITIYKNKTQQEIRKLLNQSKWLVLPTIGDAFGLVVTEAMYCGIPVIVSNIGGMKEQVINNYNGFIIKENNPQELVKIINRALSCSKYEYLKMSKNAGKSNKEYSLENVCNELNSIYKELVNEN